MQYKSTRNSKIRYTAAQAIAQGISHEGGLFVPTEFPYIGDRLKSLAALDYQGRAKEILKLFLTDYTPIEIADCVENAYAPEKFENQCPAKLQPMKSFAAMLELWHGPTCAFKDMALQILPHLLTKSMEKSGNGKKAVILVATSGDTGKAALEGFKDVPGTQILVFYPQKGVSPMQLRQMNTQEGENLSVCAVKGNFDDCQTQVKHIFMNAEIGEALAEKGMAFSSANSINWGRLLPQIIYYFSAYLDLYNQNQLGQLGEKVNFAVPTGNFGNILAAYYAKRMGLPVGKLICASNANNVLTDFIRTGVYDKSRTFYTTMSPSMDILVSSNLERLLYHLCGEDSEKLTGWMNALNTGGSYTVDASTAEALTDFFWGGSCSDEQTCTTIGALFEKERYLCDTHTAVAVKVYEDYCATTGDTTPTIVVSTASPYKFAPSVIQGVSNFTQGFVPTNDEFAVVEKLATLSGLPIPPQITALKTKKQRFDQVVDKDTIGDFVCNSIGAIIGA